MSIKKCYYYFFYKFYKFGEWSPSMFSSDFTAAFAISMLEALFLVSLMFLYIDLVDFNYPFNLSFQTVFPLAVIGILNCYLFIFNEKWKGYIKEFDRWPKRKNKAGTLIVVAIVAIIIGLFVLSVYIMAQVSGIS